MSKFNLKYVKTDSKGQHFTFEMTPNLVTGYVVFQGICELNIYEWKSNLEGKGNTILALKYLKSKSKKICIRDIGYSQESSSWIYWEKMKHKGLVDTLFNDMNEEV